MKVPKKIIAIALALFLFILLVSSVFFQVEENEQVLVTMFGDIVRKVDEPGLYMKWFNPINTLLRFDMRYQIYESIPKEILTADTKNLLINNYVVWKIEDPEQFFKSVGNVDGALIRLDNIIYSLLREQVGLYTFEDILINKRAEVSHSIEERANLDVKGFGISIVDISLKRLSFPTQNLSSIYQRMIAERNTIATQYRAEGEEEATGIRAEADREAEIIRAQAYREAQRIMAEGDEKSLSLYSQAIANNADFYFFYRLMETYKNIFNENDSLILSSDNPLMKELTGEGMNR